MSALYCFWLFSSYHKCDFSNLDKYNIHYNLYRNRYRKNLNKILWNFGSLLWNWLYWGYDYIIKKQGISRSVIIFDDTNQYTLKINMQSEYCVPCISLILSKIIRKRNILLTSFLDRIILILLFQKNKKKYNKSEIM